MPSPANPVRVASDLVDDPDLDAGLAELFDRPGVGTAIGDDHIDLADVTHVGERGGADLRAVGEHDPPRR